MLVLDEPTNHLDIDAIAWMEDRLAQHRGALILVTHDRHVLDRLTNRILELDRGSTYVHEGGYAAYLEAKAERQAQAERAEDVRRNLARTELAWLRRGAPARTSKPKARIEAATAIVEGRQQAAAREGELDLAFGTRRLGDNVIDLVRVGHRFPRRPVRANRRGCSVASTSRSIPANGSASSGPTGPASRRCSTSSPGGSLRSKERSPPASPSHSASTTSAGGSSTRR